MKIWAGLKHENILPFFGFCSQVKSGGLGGMVSPWLASGCLHNYIRQNGEHGMTVADRLKIVSGLLGRLSVVCSINEYHLSKAL